MGLLRKRIESSHPQKRKRRRRISRDCWQYNGPAVLLSDVFRVLYMCGEGPDGRARANGNGGKTISSHSQHATRPSPLVRHWFSTSRILRSRSCVYFVPPYYSLYTISIYSLLHRQSVKFFPFDRELTHRKGVVIISIAAINSPFLLFFYLVTWRSRVVFFSFFFWPSVDQQHQLVVPNFPLCEVFMSRLPILFFNHLLVY